MGARGKLQIAKGLSVVPAGTAAAAAPAHAPEKPSAVVDDEALSALWDEVVPQLDATGLISKSDGPAIELCLRHFLMARKASDEVDTVMLADKAHTGVKKHPAEAVFRAESAMFMKYAQQLGMTFVARARTPEPKGGEDDGDENPFAPGAAATS